MMSAHGYLRLPLNGVSTLIRAEEEHENPHGQSMELAIMSQKMRLFGQGRGSLTALLYEIEPRSDLH